MSAVREHLEQAPSVNLLQETNKPTYNLLKIWGYLQGRIYLQNSTLAQAEKSTCKTAVSVKEIKKFEEHGARHLSSMELCWSNRARRKFRLGTDGSGSQGPSFATSSFTFVAPAPPCLVLRKAALGAGSTSHTRKVKPDSLQRAKGACLRPWTPSAMNVLESERSMRES